MGVQHTASLSSSANFCLPPGSSKVERSIILISAQSSFSDVLLGRSHFGMDGASVYVADGILEDGNGQLRLFVTTIDILKDIYSSL
jgi:hypothetical protein